MAIDKEIRTIYRSRIDWWLWLVLVVCFVLVFICGTDLPWWCIALAEIGTVGFIVVSMFGTWYTIEGDTLSVYQFFRPLRLPILKIKEVRYCRGYLAGPALSSRRLSVSFTDRLVLKSAMPIEISPADRAAFVAHLLSINPNLKVVK